jgi:hypothetical protein
MESRAIRAAERNRKVDEEFHKTDTSLLIGPFYVFRVGDKKRFDAIQLCTTSFVDTMKMGERKAIRYLPTEE